MSRIVDAPADERSYAGLTTACVVGLENRSLSAVIANAGLALSSARGSVAPCFTG